MRKKSGNGSRPNDGALEIPQMTRAEMRRGVMGKYSRGAAYGRFVELDSDVARMFPTSESVNTVLRGIIQGLPSAAKKRRKSAK